MRYLLARGRVSRASLMMSWICSQANNLITIELQFTIFSVHSSQNSSNDFSFISVAWHLFCEEYKTSNWILNQSLFSSLLFSSLLFSFLSVSFVNSRSWVVLREVWGWESIDKFLSSNVNYNRIILYLTQSSHQNGEIKNVCQDLKLQ